MSLMPGKFAEYFAILKKAVLICAIYDGNFRTALAIIAAPR